jgi:apolipoprotein N-acyltransferase
MPWLQMLALGGMAWQLQACTKPAQAAWTGWFFATAWLSGTFWWLYVAMHTYGGLAAPLAVVAILALAAALALYFAAVCALFCAIAPVNKALCAILFGALWLAAEMARGTWLTGFGWGAAGYAHLDGLGVYAPYVGAYGIGALAAIVSFAAAAFARGLMPLKIKMLTGAALPIAVVALGAVALHWVRPAYSLPGPTLNVALLQGNIAQDEKFEAGTGVADSLRWYGQQLQSIKADLIVAPETAIPILPQQLPEGYWDALTGSLDGRRQALMTGIPLGSYKDGYTNSVVAHKPGSAPYRYDKHHLVPFGEFIPPWFKWFTQMMNIPLGDFNRGDVGQLSFEWRGQRLAPNICYEDLFGEELGARFAIPAQAPTVFVNVSNMGWFGDTVAIDQHLAISRMRALEFQRPFIRATNTGATVVIDHTGHVTHSLPRHTRGVLLAPVQGRGGDASNGHGLTPFAGWMSRFGLWPLWGFSFAATLWAGVARHRRAKNADPAL